MIIAKYIFVEVNEWYTQSWKEYAEGNFPFTIPKNYYIIYYKDKRKEVSKNG